MNNYQGFGVCSECDKKRALRQRPGGQWACRRCWEGELTPEQSQAAYDAAPTVPLSEKRIKEIVDYAVGRRTELPSHSITVAWLHAIRPDAWREAQRGIDYANWTIHTIRSEEEGYDFGPFVWTVAPSHGQNMTVLERPCESHFTILVLETRQDVIRLLQLLVPEWQACDHGVKDGDYCEPCNRETKAARAYEENL